MDRSRALAETAGAVAARAPVRPALLQIAAVFGAISATSFGGGQKASIRRQVVTAHRWMNEDEFMEGLEFAQVMPGPNILNLAVYCGQRARGVPGAIVAFLGVSIPAFVIVLVAGALYFRFIGNAYVHAALIGCAAGAVGLTLGNAIELSIDLKEDLFNFVLLAATTVAVTRFHASLLLVLLAFGTMGIVRHRRRKMRAHS
jgi:chromate transporter